jgi:hypothetical protein
VDTTSIDAHRLQDTPLIQSPALVNARVADTPGDDWKAFDAGFSKYWTYISTAPPSNGFRARKGETLTGSEPTVIPMILSRMAVRRAGIASLGLVFRNVTPWWPQVAPNADPVMAIGSGQSPGAGTGAHVTGATGAGVPSSSTGEGVLTGASLSSLSSGISNSLQQLRSFITQEPPMPERGTAAIMTWLVTF